MEVAQANQGSGTDPQRSLSNVLRGETSKLGPLLDVYRNYLRILADAQLDRKLRGKVSPSDIVQETMLQAHRDFGQFRGKNERELLGWLRKIHANTLARVIERHVLAKKRDVRREVSLQRIASTMEQSSIQLNYTMASRDETPSSGARRRERAVILADVMSELPNDQREILLLRNMQGLKFREAAERMNRSVAATKMLWMRAIKRARELYEDRDEG